LPPENYLKKRLHKGCVKLGKRPHQQHQHKAQVKVAKNHQVKTHEVKVKHRVAALVKVMVKVKAKDNLV
jgi:hypothetical protein